MWALINLKEQCASKWNCMHANGTACKLRELNAGKKDLKRFENIHRDLLNHTVMFRPCAFLHISTLSCMQANGTECKPKRFEKI